MLRFVEKSLLFFEPTLRVVQDNAIERLILNKENILPLVLGPCHNSVNQIEIWDILKNSKSFITVSFNHWTNISYLKLRF